MMQKYFIIDYPRAFTIIKSNATSNEMEMAAIDYFYDKDADKATEDLIPDINSDVTKFSQSLSMRLIMHLKAKGFMAGEIAITPSQIVKYFQDRFPITKHQNYHIKNIFNHAHLSEKVFKNSGDGESLKVIYRVKRNGPFSYTLLKPKVATPFNDINEAKRYIREVLNQS